MSDDRKTIATPTLFQWSLRSLFVVITLLAVALGLYWRGVHCQARFVALARAAGAKVAYDHQMEGLGMMGYEPPPHPHKWLVDLVGADALYAVKLVEFLHCREPLSPELLDATCACSTLQTIALRPGEPQEVVERLDNTFPHARIHHRPAWSEAEWAEYRRVNGIGLKEELVPPRP